MSSTAHQDSAGQYRNAGWHIERAVIEPARAGLLVARLVDEEVGERGVPFERELYGDPEFDRELERLTPVLAGLLGFELSPTYSFARVYPRGLPLYLHRDRPACEHSVSVHLGASTTATWPLWVRDLRHQRFGAELALGDGLVYQGTAVPHWRSACPVAWYAQAFFHYVATSGPRASERFDRRPALGLPAETKRSR